MKVNFWQNLPLKILAVFLAFFLWIYFTGEQKILRDIDIPLDINIPPDKILLGEYSSSVTVRVRGTETTISRLGNRFIYSSIDLTNYPLGEKSIQISVREHIHGLPPDLDVVSITPERIKVTVEQRATKEIPILANISGKPKKPFIYYGYDINPHSILIEGAERDVRVTEKAMTEVIDINEKRGSFRINTDIMPDNPAVKLVNPISAVVHVKIGKDVEEITFEDVAITYIHQEQLFTSSHERVSLTIAGPKDVLRNIDTSSIRASINLSNLKPSNKEYLLTPIFTFPSLKVEDISRLAITSWRPETVAVKIQLRSVTK